MNLTVNIAHIEHLTIHEAAPLCTNRRQAQTPADTAGARVSAFLQRIGRARPTDTFRPAARACKTCGGSRQIVCNLSGEVGAFDYAPCPDCSQLKESYDPLF